MNAPTNLPSAYKAALARLDHRDVSASAVPDSAFNSARYNPAIGNWSPVLGSANADLEPERETITARSRDLWRNNPVANSIVTRIVTNAIGTQLKLQPIIDHDYLGVSKEEADTMSKKIEIEWQIFSSKELDEARRFNFTQICGQLMTSMCVCGDVFATTPNKKRKNSFNPYRTCVKVLEADRVSNPYGVTDDENLTGGIQLRDAELWSIWVTEQHHGDTVLKKYGWKEVPFFGAKTGRRRVMHLVNPNMLRPEQLRGVSLLSIIQSVIKKLKNWTESELTRANLQSDISGLVVKLAEDFGGRPLFGKNINEPLPSAQKRVEFYTQNHLRMGEGSSLILLPGDNVEFPPISAPNAHFESFYSAILNEAGAGTIPASVIMQVFKSSYSAARAELNEAWTMYLWLRQWLVWDFCEPLYQIFLDEAVALGRLNLPGYFNDPAIQLAWSGVKFIAPTQRHIDEQKAASAAQKRIENNTSSQRDECERNGNDFDAVMQQRIREREQEYELQQRFSQFSQTSVKPQPQPNNGAIDETTGALISLNDLRESADAEGFTSVSDYLSEHEELNLL